MIKHLKILLLQNKTAIIECWRNLIFDTYPDDGLHFFKQEKDKFANPVGSTIAEGTEAIYNELIGGENIDLLTNYLDSIIRVRAVQNFSPSGALIFIPLLKKAILEKLDNEIRKNGLFEELLKLESTIDDLMLLSIDIFMKCRGQIYEIQFKEVNAERDVALKLLARTNSKDEV